MYVTPQFLIAVIWVTVACHDTDISVRFTKFTLNFIQLHGNYASFNLSCPTHYHISHQIVQYILRKYAYHSRYVDSFTNLTIKISNNKSVASISSPALKLDKWPWKTVGHLFYATLSSVHHFKAIGDFKLKLQSGNAQFGSKWAIFVPCHLEIWRMTLKNNRAPLLCCFKLCASFHSLQWIQTGVTVWKSSIWVKIDDFLAVWPWNLMDDLEKQ